MTADEAPVAEDEWVLRLIAPAYYRAGLPLPIQPEAFRPLDKGEAGISVFRARFADPLQALTVVAESKRHGYYVARLAVLDLLALGLSVRPDPIEKAPGHAIIPELNTADYQGKKAFWKVVQRQLAELASKDIVHRPSV
jgi:hypothetical protein